MSLPLMYPHIIREAGFELFSDSGLVFYYEQCVNLITQFSTSPQLILKMPWPSLDGLPLINFTDFNIFLKLML